MSTATRFDTVVIGGGPAGAAAAVALHRGGGAVALVTRTPAGRGVHAARRGQSAPPGTDRLVRAELGERAFNPDAHQRVLGNRSDWGDGTLVDTDFMFNPFGCGWHLDRDAFDADLVGAARAAGVTVIAGTIVDARRELEWTLTLVTPGGHATTVRASFVCDASGRRAVVARQHGAQVIREDRLVACITSSIAGDGEPRSTVEAVVDGWWYTAPTPDGTRITTYFTDPGLHRRGSTIERAWFERARRSTTHVEALTTPMHADTTVVVVDASPTQRTRVVGTGWLAAGDAAATFDPLSSQGILTALLTGRAAGTAILGALGRDPGDATDSALQQYGALIGRAVDDHRRERAQWYAADRTHAGNVFWAQRGARVAA